MSSFDCRVCFAEALSATKSTVGEADGAIGASEGRSEGADTCVGVTDGLGDDLILGESVPVCDSVGDSVRTTLG